MVNAELLAENAVRFAETNPLIPAVTGLMLLHLVPSGKSPLVKQLPVDYRWPPSAKCHTVFLQKELGVSSWGTETDIHSHPFQPLGDIMFTVPWYCLHYGIHLFSFKFAWAIHQMRDAKSRPLSPKLSGFKDLHTGTCGDTPLLQLEFQTPQIKDKKKEYAHHTCLSIY